MDFENRAEVEKFLKAETEKLCAKSPMFKAFVRNLMDDLFEINFQDFSDIMDWLLDEEDAEDD